MSRSRWGRRAAAAAVVAVAAATVTVIAPVTPAGAVSAQAYVRGAHFSPDTASVDVYLSAFSGGTSTLWLSSVSYGDVSSYAPIAAGVYAVSMRPHGASASSPAVLTWTVDLSAGSAYTAAAVGTNSQLRGIVLHDSTTAPAAHTGMVRVIQASSQAGHISVTAQNGPVVVSDIAYGAASDYVSVPAGSWNLVTQSTTQPSLSNQLSVTVASGTLSSVVVLDKAGGGIVVRNVVDSSGASTIPTGSVSAGGGGTAQPAHSDTSNYALLSLAAFSGAALLALFGVRGRRRLRTSRT
jgi:Domain of unknown function (DUF4397)